MDIKTLLQDLGTNLSFEKVVQVIVLALVAWIVIRMILRILGRVVEKSHLNETIKNYLMRGVKVALYVLGAIIIASHVGIDMTALVALLSVFSLGVTLAAEDVLGNMAGGLVIATSRPFTIGDYIEVDGTAGTVREITLNHTKMETFNGEIIVQPNQEMANSKIINYSTLGRLRVVRVVSASYDTPTERVKEACWKAIETVRDRVLDDPAPDVHLLNYGSSTIEYQVRCWTDKADYWDVHFELGEALRKAFTEHDVAMSYEHLNVHILDR